MSIHWYLIWGNKTWTSCNSWILRINLIWSYFIILMYFLFWTPSIFLVISILIFYVLFHLILVLRLNQFLKKPRTLYLFIYLFIAISWAAPVAYGSSQARGQIRAIAAGLCHSHSHVGSELQSATYLHHSSWQHGILNTLSEARDRTRILKDTSWVLYHWTTTGAPLFANFLNISQLHPLLSISSTTFIHLHSTLSSLLGDP